MMLIKKKAIKMSLNFQELMRPVPRRAVFRMAGWQVWGGTTVRGNDGYYYLYFSRWRKELEHSAWCTHSEVGYATADNPLGPFVFKGTALKGRGGEYWDAHCIHNPAAIKINGRYYIYYMGNKGNGEYWNHRNNQRVGVAEAEHPAGPWKRLDKPVIDVTPGSFDHLLTSNPTVAQSPDGRILMVYKAVGDGILPRGGPVNCGVAVADYPTGPFKKFPEPIMTNPENDWSVEDPCVWYQDDRFYALVKDFQGYFSKDEKNTVALFESFDGAEWAPAEHPLAFKKEIHWEDGEVQKVAFMERPQLLLENGTPKVLYCAVSVGPKAKKDSFNIHIPLKES